MIGHNAQNIKQLCVRFCMIRSRQTRSSEHFYTAVMKKAGRKCHDIASFLVGGRRNDKPFETNVRGGAPHQLCDGFAAGVHFSPPIGLNDTFFREAKPLADSPVREVEHAVQLEVQRHKRARHDGVNGQAEVPNVGKRLRHSRFWSDACVNSRKTGRVPAAAEPTTAFACDEVGFRGVLRSRGTVGGKTDTGREIPQCGKTRLATLVLGFASHKVSSVGAYDHGESIAGNPSRQLASHHQRIAPNSSRSDSNADYCFRSRLPTWT
jgi:hypothetical protein